MPVFPLGRDTGAAALELGIPHVQLVLLAPHQDETKQGRRCSHSTSALDDLWTAFPWVKSAGLASPVFRGAFWTYGRTNVYVPSQFREVVPHLGLCEFHKDGNKDRFKSWQLCGVWILPFWDHRSIKLTQNCV